MNNKNNLFEELNIKGQGNLCNGPLDVDIQNVKNRFNSKIRFTASERKLFIVKFKKIFVLAAAAAVTLGIAVFGASLGIVSNWVGSSSSKPDYSSLPTASQVEKDVGYCAALVEKFKNGYEFKNGRIVKNILSDENGTPVEEYNSLSFEYAKNGDTVVLMQKKYNSAINLEGEIISSLNGTDIYYFAYANKQVPSNYQKNDDDKKAEARGELVFSYGSLKTEIKKVQSVSWIDNGINYQLFQIDGKLTAEELLKMATEIIKN